MKTSAKLLLFLEKEEGCVLHPYRDQAGVPTIGIGTTMYPNGKKVTMKDPAITKEKAYEYLLWEVRFKEKSVDAFTSNLMLTQNQFDALNSLAYNVGVGGVEGSSVLKFLKLNGPTNTKLIKTEEMTDVSVKAWFKKQNIRAISIITYYFCLWSKITDQKSGKKVLCEDLIRRRMREATLYWS